jgi:thioredoxin 1
MKHLFFRTVMLATTAFCLSLAAGSGQAAERINLQGIIAKKVPVLFEFGRGWCIPCKYMKPILTDMEKAYAGRAVVATVDMDANADLVRSFRIRMMPTQVFLAPDGKEFFRNEGVLERQQIVDIFAKMGVKPAGPLPSQAQAAPIKAPPQPAW